MCDIVECCNCCAETCEGSCQECSRCVNDCAYGSRRENYDTVNTKPPVLREMNREAPLQK